MVVPDGESAGEFCFQDPARMGAKISLLHRQATAMDEGGVKCTASAAVRLAGQAGSSTRQTCIDHCGMCNG
jgi:hypothetical protein